MTKLSFLRHNSKQLRLWNTGILFNNYKELNKKNSDILLHLNDLIHSVFILRC